MKKTIIYLIFVTLFSATMLGQTRKGDRQYEDLAYVNATKTYDRLIAKNIF